MSATPGDPLVRLYQETIRRHSAEPTGFRQSIQPTHRHEAYNPLCGDRVDIHLRVAGERIESAAFDGEACAICMASASILCGLAPGRPLQHLRQLHDDLQSALRSDTGTETPASNPEDAADSKVSSPPLHEDLLPLLGVRPYPSRIQCAMLPWKAAMDALEG